MTRQFWQKTLMHYSSAEVGPEKVKEWIAKLELIRKVALKKREIQLAKERPRPVTSNFKILSPAGS